LAHKAEHAVDMKTGAIVAVTLQPADRGDTTSIAKTIDQADKNLVAVMKDDGSCKQLSEQVLREVGGGQGVSQQCGAEDHRERDIRTYISEPDRGDRNWKETRKPKRRCMGIVAGFGVSVAKGLMRRRGELVERSFAHCYDTGGMRRTHLREHENILKRLLIHAAGFQLELDAAQGNGLGTARGLQGLLARIWECIQSPVPRSMVVPRPVLRQVRINHRRPICS